MGTDIAYIVEFQDDQGVWNGLYSSELFWTQWWQSRLDTIDLTNLDVPSRFPSRV